MAAGFLNITMDVNIPFSVTLIFGLYALHILLILNQRPKLRSAINIWFFLTILTTSLWFNLIQWQALPFLIVYIGFGFLTLEKIRWRRWLGWTGVVIMALALSIHVIPGFDNALLFSAEHLGNGTLPYKLYANLDKALAAALILALVAEHLKPFSLKQFARQDLPIMLGGAIIIFALGMALGAEFDPKFGELTIAFLFFNLLVTCVAEEAYFRLLFQETLWKLIPLKKWSGILAIVISAALFTLAHFHTGEGAVERLTVIFLAGILYAVVYWRSRQYLSAVLAHFSINFIHLSFFTYPF